MKIKTIDISVMEWRDKVNGNTYFSANVCLNYSMNDQVNVYLPFQYGDASHAENTVVMRELINRKLVKADDRTILWRYCEENKIVLRKNKTTGKKREVVAFGFYNAN